MSDGDERSYEDMILERVSKIRAALKKQQEENPTSNEGKDNSELSDEQTSDKVWGQWDSWNSWSKSLN